VEVGGGEIRSARKLQSVDGILFDAPGRGSSACGGIISGDVQQLLPLPPGGRKAPLLDPVVSMPTTLLSVPAAGWGCDDDSDTRTSKHTRLSAQRKSSTVDEEIAWLEDM
jgi:hypothetical protein